MKKKEQTQIPGPDQHNQKKILTGIEPATSVYIAIYIAYCSTTELPKKGEKTQIPGLGQHRRRQLQDNVMPNLFESS